MKKKLIDRYLELEESFVKNVLNDSYSVNEFWKKLNIGAPLRTNRGGNQWKQFEDKFGIQIRQTINLNIEKQNAQQQLIELNKDRVCKNPRCKNHFTWKEHPNSDFCSKSCAASYSAQHADPENIRNGMKNSFKDVPCAGGCGKILHVKSSTTKKYCETCKITHYKIKFGTYNDTLHQYETTCEYCGKVFKVNSYRKTCCKEHEKLLRIQSFRLKQSIYHTCGGKRSHSGRGKQGRYHGIWCDSSWELAWVIYQEEHQIKFKKYHGYFEYEFEGQKHKYYPDFELEDGTIVEIKGYWSKQWQAKLDQLPKDRKLLILGKNEMIPILEYVKVKYGDNFIQLYE